MRYTVDYQTGSFDEPDQYQYRVRDTKNAAIVARVHVHDYIAHAAATSLNNIDIRKRYIYAELKALDYAQTIAEKLEEASDNGEII